MKWVISFFITVVIFFTYKWAITSDVDSTLRLISNGASDLEVAWNVFYPIFGINLALLVILFAYCIYKDPENETPECDYIGYMYFFPICYFLSIYITLRSHGVTNISTFLGLLGFIFNILYTRGWVEAIWIRITKPLNKK